MDARQPLIAGASAGNFGAMTKITFIDSSGEARNVDAEQGSTVMESAVRNGIPEIEAECGGACACATCHVYVEPEWMDAAGKPEPMEEDMLERRSHTPRRR